MTAEVVAGLLAAIVAAAASWLVAYRKLSGKIGTSEASALWAESASIRDDYREQLAVANRRIAELEGRVANLEERNTMLERENAQLRRDARL